MKMYTFLKTFRAVMLLSCPAKKVTKECGIGEALSVALPRAKDALSYVPLPSRIWWQQTTLTKNLLFALFYL